MTVLEFCHNHPDIGFWLSGILICGVVSAWCARLAEGSRHEKSCHRVFMFSLSLVGLCTIAALVIGPGLCMASGTTFTGMAVAATWDPGRAIGDLGL